MSEEIRIIPRFKNLIPPLTPEELEQLEANILADGCRDPLVTWNGVLVDGHNRYGICKKHKLPFKTKAMEFANEDEACIWMIRLQFGRRNLPPYVRGDLALKLAPLLEKKAKDNQRQSAGRGKKGLQNSVNLITPIDTQKELAKLAGLSHDSIAKCKLIAKHADEETKQKLRRSETTINAVAKEIKRTTRHQEVKEKARDTEESCKVSHLAELVQAGRKFGTIYVDPPWPYENQGTRAATNNHYSMMSIDDIIALPVADLAAENAHLHLWTTNAFLFEAPRILEAWGFVYKSLFVWVKPQMGIGNYWRVSHELLVLGVRGQCPFSARDLMSWKEIRRSGHSKKPEEVRQMIEKASPGPRLELFANGERDDWVVWGKGVVPSLFDGTTRAV